MIVLRKNKYYLYQHRNPETKRIFYVGVGTSTRPFEFSKSKRSKEWIDVYEMFGVQVEILEEFSSRKEAFAEEIKLIRQYRESEESLLNVTEGGMGMKGVSPWNAGKSGHLPEEVLLKLSEAGKRTFATKEARTSHSLNCGGRAFRVIEISTGNVVWHGVNQKQCERDLGLSQRNISKALRDAMTTVKGHRCETITNGDPLVIEITNWDNLRAEAKRRALEPLKLGRKVRHRKRKNNEASH